MWALHHELFLFLQCGNFFRYVSENDIEGNILVWTKSIVSDRLGYVSPQVLEFLGEGDEYYIHFDDCCFFSLFVLFVLTFASLCFTFFLWKSKVKQLESVSGEVCVLKKLGGRKNMHSVFEGFLLFQCVFRGQTKQSLERRVIPIWMSVLVSNTNAPSST